MAVAIQEPPVQRAVREALENFLCPELCTAVVLRALRRDRMPKIPEDGVRLGRWVRRSLRPEVAAQAGSDAANAIVRELDSIVAQLHHRALGGSALSEAPTDPHFPMRPPRVDLSAPTDIKLPSFAKWAVQARPAAARARPHGQLPAPPSPARGLRASRRPAAPAAPAIRGGGADGAREVPLPAAPRPADSSVHEVPNRALRGLTPVRAPHEGVPQARVRILIASTDARSVAQLRMRHGAAAEIEHISDAGALMEAPPIHSDERVALILDCRHPTVHAATVAGLADELPYGWWVIAWGVDDLTWDELEEDRKGPQHWMRCSADTSWNDIVNLSSGVLRQGR